MSLIHKSAAYISTVTDATAQSFAKFSQHIADNPSGFAFTLFCALLSYIVINLYKLKLYKKQDNRKILIFIHVFFPFIFVLFTYYSLRNRPADPLYIMLNYLAFYWLAGAILKVPSRFLGISVKRCFPTVMWFILAALLLEIYSDLLRLYANFEIRHVKSFMTALDGLSRCFLSLGFYIYIRMMIAPLLAALKSRHPKFPLVSIPAGFITTVFALVSALWVVDVVHFDFRFIMSAGFIVLISALISQLSSNSETLASKVFNHEYYTPLEWEQIKNNIVRLFTVTVIYVCFTLGSNLLDISSVAENLKTVYIIHTSLFKLSVSSLVSALLIFLLLKSLLFLAAKYLRVALNGGVQTAESGSLEVLMSNIGILFVIMITLLEMGITWQIIVPVAGALGIGVGFGIQTIINNYLSGFILLFSKKVRIGDYVEVPGTAGRAVGVTSDTVFGAVVSIDMFATTVRTFDSIELMVPNSVFISDNIVNYTRSDSFIRVRIPVGIGYSSDVDLAQKLMLDAINECEYVLRDKPAEVWFTEYGESSLNFLVLFWLDVREGLQSVTVKNIFLQSLWHKFKEHDIEIPFPQQDVWFRNELKCVDTKENKQ